MNGFFLALLLQTSIHPIQNLDWDNKHQSLTYRTCGCADSCWTVTVVNKKSGYAILALRSDCENIYLKRKSNTEKKLSIGSQWFETEDKFEKIKSVLEAAL